MGGAMSITAEVKKGLNILTEEERNIIIRNGIHLRIVELEDKLIETQRNIEILEKKFHKTLAEILKEGLHDKANFKTHSDFIELECLYDDYEDVSKKTKTLKKL